MVDLRDGNDEGEKNALSSVNSVRKVELWGLLV